MSSDKRSSLLGYWSVRYFVVLFGCMAFIGALATILIQMDIKREQQRSMAGMAEQIAAAAAAGRLAEGEQLGRWLDDLSIRYDRDERVVLIITDSDGTAVRQFPPHLPAETAQLRARQSQIRSGEPQMFTLQPLGDRPPFLVAVHPLPGGAGEVQLLIPEYNFMDTFRMNGIPRLLVVITLVLTGWGVIYMLTRRLIRPIQEAANAAKQVVAGNYDVQLSKEHREREIAELMLSFKEMAERLSRLESLRTQLLASVTHELKTPVASISGLMQAVKAGVVKGEEADRFLENGLKECRRLQKMVEDLLDFNSFAGNAVAVVQRPCDLDKLVRAICARWEYGRGETKVSVSVETTPDAAVWQASADPDRLEQIVINLLNNAADAMGQEGVIRLLLFSDSDRIGIHVKDTGHGIPEAEQLDIFEPFYRGKQKKSNVRGLGIGLPFSRLIARSMDGDLVLTDSSPAGATFTLFLPRGG